jgi:hypothetical protein
MNAYATKLSEGFSQRVLQRYYQKAVARDITNQDYEGDITDKQSKVNIMTFGAVGLKTYSGADLTVDDVYESIGSLTTDQMKAWYFRIKSLDQFKSWIKNPSGTLIEQCGNALKEAIDAHVLGLYGDVAAGNRIGTDYVTGDVAVANTTGAVTGNGTTFTAAMVGKGFKATGHTKWYRVKSYASATSIVIENDSDDEVSAYDGGAISGGSSYIVQANTAVQVAKSTFYNKLVDLKTVLDKAKAPTTDRWFVAPADILNLALQGDSANPVVTPVPSAYQDKVQNGYVGRLAGFDCYSNEQVTGDATNGYHCLAGHKSGITLAMGFTESGIEDLVGNFGKAYKGLTVWGAKVPDLRRAALAEGFFKL